MDWDSLKVKVVGAPGFEDFEGPLLMTVPSVVEEMMAVVGTEIDGKRSFEVIPYKYIQDDSE